MSDGEGIQLQRVTDYSPHPSLITAGLTTAWPWPTSGRLLFGPLLPQYHAPLSTGSVKRSGWVDPGCQGRGGSKAGWSNKQ